MFPARMSSSITHGMAAVTSRLPWVNRPMSGPPLTKVQVASANPHGHKYTCRLSSGISDYRTNPAPRDVTSDSVNVTDSGSEFAWVLNSCRLLRISVLCGRGHWHMVIHADGWACPRQHQRRRHPDGQCGGEPTFHASLGSDNAPGPHEGAFSDPVDFTTRASAAV